MKATVLIGAVAAPTVIDGPRTGQFEEAQRVRRTLLNIILSLVGAWFALLDHCLIVASEMPISREIVELLILQASIGAFLWLFANGAFPTMAEMATDARNARLNLIVFGIPLILFLGSPVMISETLYEARYGYINKFVVNAHVGHDLTCCLNPLAGRVARERM